MVLVVKVGLGKARAKPKPAQIHVTNAASRLQLTASKLRLLQPTSNDRKPFGTTTGNEKLINFLLCPTRVLSAMLSSGVVGIRTRTLNFTNLLETHTKCFGKTL